MPKATKARAPKAKPPPDTADDNGPRTDAFLSIHTPHVENILAGIKNHEFRNCHLPAVEHFWLYETKPTQAVRFVMSVGAARRPGEVPASGLRNDVFNRGESKRFAYPILKVERLDAPLTLAGMRERGLLRSPPQGYMYHKAAMRAVAPGLGREVVFDCTAEGGTGAAGVPDARVAGPAGASAGGL
jgi:predicted transcriptional regulator